MDAEMSTNSTHGAYDWVPNFFKINYVNSNMTMEAINDRYSNLTVVERVEEVTFEALGHALRHPEQTKTLHSSIILTLNQ